MNQHVGVEEMAQAAGVSPAHLRRLFMQTRNESPLQAINQLRLERARHLLRDTELAVAEIADIVGMSGPTVFCRWYKTATGHTPLEHRKLVRMDAR
jgi:transcriptional regulator GlxA family with amidase domain